MNAFHKALTDFERIKGISSRLAKIQALKEAESTEFWGLLNVAINPYVTLGARVEQPAVKRTPTTYAEFQAAVQQLGSRNISGGQAQNMLAELVGGVPEQHQKIFMDILNKEPRIGVERKTANAVWDKFVPIFSPQLAEDSKDQPFPKQAVAEPKFDGLRALMFITSEKNYLLTRNGLPIYNADHVTTEAQKLEYQTGVYDGELFGMTFHQSVGTAHRSVSEATELLYYHVFDYLTLEEWKAMHCVESFRRRREYLLDICTASHGKFIQPVQQEEVHSLEDALKWARYWKKQGLEGAVVKDLAAPYVFKRTRAWLKVKFTATFDIPVIGMEEGKGKNKGTLGKLVCIYKKREVRVGGGLSDALRDQWWGNPDLIVGKTIEVEADEDETHKGSLRFPRFVRVREDK